MILLVLLGCTRREHENPAEAPHPPPAHPSGPQVQRTDSLLNAAAPRLAAWVAMWRAALPGFEADSLWAAGRGRWQPGSPAEGEAITDSKNPDDFTFELLVFPSPGGDHVLYVDHYQAVVADGDGIEVGGEPDSRSALVDRRTNRMAVLRACGTVCGSHWGAWLSRTSFALAGWQDADEHSQWKQGTLSIYSIPDSTVATYVTRIVLSRDYERYVDAWERWLLERYRVFR